MTESKKHSPHGRTVLAVGTAHGSGEAKGVIVEGSVMPDGREAWRIISGDKIISLITSSTSTAIMDEAVQIYGPALKRLAKR
jgi:hypothetical protein